MLGVNVELERLGEPGYTIILSAIVERVAEMHKEAQDGRGH